MVTTSPFELDNTSAYLAWRENKLFSLPNNLDSLGIEIKDSETLRQVEINQIKTHATKYNLALLRFIKPLQHHRQLKAFCTYIGLAHINKNLRADVTGISSIRDKAQKGTNYIPYTNKPLSWHTDGYYNSASEQIHSWVLYCQQPAPSGGISELIDHEMLYLHLRDQSPELIRSLMKPDAMTIPANSENSKLLRSAQTGPVFSINTDGSLHMRYSARQRHIHWHPECLTAKKAIENLLSSEEIPIYRYRLQAGECIISNNILHRRTAFRDGQEESNKRVVWRARYYERISKV